MRKLISRLLPRSKKASSNDTTSDSRSSNDPENDAVDASGTNHSAAREKQPERTGSQGGRPRQRNSRNSSRNDSGADGRGESGSRSRKPRSRSKSRKPRSTRSRDSANDPEPDVIPAGEHRIDASRVSRNALEVVEGLRDAGYSAELVGGCVRDLLLGLRPKDFDIATNATPEDVRDIFRRARLVGRRFRLAHVRVGRDVLEVATYRAAPGADGNEHALTDDGRLITDNIYGTRGQDAVRRDFTVNALYYDPISAEVLDYVGGYDDVIERRLTVIGDAERRLREDPVRILRAVRFASRLDLDVEDSCASAMPRLAHLLADTPPARLFDEILKLFHYGHAADTFAALQDHGVFEHLFPETADVIESGDPIAGPLLEKAFTNTDTRVNEGKPVIAPFLFAAALWRPMSERYETYLEDGQDQRSALYNAAEDTIAIQNERIAIPRRVATPTREIWSFQSRLESQSKKRIARFVEHKRFRAAYDFLLLRAAAGEVTQELADWWTSYAEAKPSSRARPRQDGDADSEGGQRTGPPRRRRKRGGRRRKKPQAAS